MSLKSIAKVLTPQTVWYAAKKVHRHLKWRTSRLRGQVLTEESLLAEFERIGIRRGDTLLVHSSLTALGHVEGGPDAVIDALLGAVGSAGTLLMPAFPDTGEWMDYVLSDPLFDPQTSPSSRGKISDIFWRRPGVLRSLHPTHSVAALGPVAEYLVRDHERSPMPCGPDTPYGRLVDLDGRILHLGSPFWATPSFHLVEDAVPDFPRPVYRDEPAILRYLDLDGAEHSVPVLVHNPELVPQRIDKVKTKEEEIYRLCKDRRVLHTDRIGPAVAHLIEARLLEELLEELVRKGITIYV